MSLSLWEYVRRRTCDAVLAGVQDALDHLEGQDQAQLIFAIAKTLRRRLHEAGSNGGHNSKPETHPLFDKRSPECAAQPPANDVAKPLQPPAQPAACQKRRPTNSPADQPQPAPPAGKTP